MAFDSHAERSARVKGQLRDKKGRWIEMGGGITWTTSSGITYSGKATGVEGDNVIVSGVMAKNARGYVRKLPNDARVAATDVEATPKPKAFIPADDWYDSQRTLPARPTLPPAQRATPVQRRQPDPFDVPGTPEYAEEQRIQRESREAGASEETLRKELIERRQERARQKAAAPAATPPRSGSSDVVVGDRVSAVNGRFTGTVTEEERNGAYLKVDVGNGRTVSFPRTGVTRLDEPTEPTTPEPNPTPPPPAPTPTPTPAAPPAPAPASEPPSEPPAPPGFETGAPVVSSKTGQRGTIMEVFFRNGLFAQVKTNDGKILTYPIEELSPGGGGSAPADPVPDAPAVSAPAPTRPAVSAPAAPTAPDGPTLPDGTPLSVGDQVYFPAVGGSDPGVIVGIDPTDPTRVEVRSLQDGKIRKLVTSRLQYGQHAQSKPTTPAPAPRAYAVGDVLTLAAGEHHPALRARCSEPDTWAITLASDADATEEFYPGRVVDDAFFDDFSSEHLDYAAAPARQDAPMTLPDDMTWPLQSGTSLAATQDPNTGEVLALVASGPTAVFVREDAEWTPAAPDDPRVGGTVWVAVAPSFATVVDSGVPLTDELVQQHAPATDLG